MNNYSEEIKQQAFERYLCGYNGLDISEELIIPFSTVYTWIRAWKKECAEKTLADCSLHEIGTILRHTEEQKKQIEKLTLELSIIHESGILQTIPLSQRLEAAATFGDTHSAAWLCRAFELKLPTFYYHKRTRDQIPKRQQEDIVLSDTIREIYEVSGRRFGAKRILFQLQKRGIRTSRKRVIRLMKEMNLRGEVDAVPYFTPESSSYPPANSSYVKIL